MRDFIVKILTKLGLYKKSVEALNKLKFELQARRMKRYGLEMLVAADKAYTRAGIKLFLTYGTLLGAYRDHGFIHYDFDVDLGILADEMNDKVYDEMRKEGFIPYKQIYMGDNEEVIEDTFIYKKLHLDVFYYFERGEDLCALDQLAHESKDWKEANISDGFPSNENYVPKSDFERRDFLGHQIFMPVKTDAWLKSLYSENYMTPIKNWTPDGQDVRIYRSKRRSYRRYF